MLSSLESPHSRNASTISFGVTLQLTVLLFSSQMPGEHFQSLTDDLVQVVSRLCGFSCSNRENIVVGLFCRGVVGREIPHEAKFDC